MTQCEICGARTGLHGFSFDRGPTNEPENPYRGQIHEDRFQRFWVWNGNTWLRWKAGLQWMIEQVEREANERTWLSLSEGSWGDEDDS